VAQNEANCPNCGAAVMPPRVFCKLSCRIAYEHREYTRQPRLCSRSAEHRA